MTPNVPADNPPPDQPAPAPLAGADEFRAEMESFWSRNRSLIVGLCVLGLAGVLGFEAYRYFGRMREEGVRQDYARIADQPEKLAAFAGENEGHALAGVAWLRLADEAYGKGDFKTAATHYQKAAPALKHDALKNRAVLGAAMSQLAAGDRTAAEAALKALAGDDKALAAVRAEANYHLAVAAREAGQNEQALKYLEEISKLEATGMWAQRGFMLRTQLETAGATPPAPKATPSLQFKPGS